MHWSNVLKVRCAMAKMEQHVALSATCISDTTY